MIKPERWVSMKLTYLGDVRSLLRGGGGKMSPTAADTGDVRKPKGAN